MRLVRTAILVVCSLFAVELWAEQCEISVDHANARKEANSSADVIAVLSKGEVHPVIDDVPYWYQIELHNGRRFRSMTKSTWLLTEMQPLFQLWIGPAQDTELRSRESRRVFAGYDVDDSLSGRPLNVPCII